MIDDSPAAYRATLRDQLEAVGELATDMLAGRAPADPLVVLGAIEAAGLLDAVTVGAAHAPLRDRVIGAATASATLPPILADLDLSPDAVDLDAGEPDEREDRLARLLALAGVAAVVGYAPIHRVLERNRSIAELEPAALGDLHDVAGFIVSALDLDADHPAHALLEAVEASGEPHPSRLPHGAFARGLARARAVLFPEPKGWAAWATQWARDLVDLFAPAEPVPAFAADAPPLPEPARRLDTRGDEELVLLRRGDALYLGWTGRSDAPTQASLFPDRIALTPVPAPFDDTRMWRLPATPPSTGPLSVHLDGPNPWTVRLGVPRD